MADTFLERLSQRRALVPWLIFALGVGLLFPSIWSETSITASDEYVLTLRTPMEMIERGQFLTPWVNEEPRLRKPPLMYWLIYGSYQVLGINLTAARIWSVLAGAGVALSACLLERRLYRSSGLLSGLLAIASVGVAASARQAMLDLPLAGCVGLAVCGFVRWLQEPRLLALLFTSAWLGASFLIKGPIGLLFFAAAALPGLWIFGNWRSLLEHAGQWFLALLLLAAICLPWPLAMNHLWADRFAKIMTEEMEARQFGDWSGMAPLSALSGALGLIAPWTPAAVLAMWGHWRTRKADRNPATAWLIVWTIVSVLPFFFMKAFERYMLAVLPAQAVLAGMWLQNEARAQRVSLAIATVGLAALAVLASAVALWFQLALLTPLLTLALTAWLLRRLRQPHAAVPLALGAGVLLMLILGGLYPALGISYLPRGVEQTVGQRTASTFALHQPAMLSMRLQRSVQNFRTDTIKPGTEQAVFVERASLPEFESAMRAAGLQSREIGQFGTFYSRRAWLKFFRHDATAADWKKAIRERSLESLRTPFLIYEVRRPAAP